MEIIRGKQASFIDSSALAERLNGYSTIHIDMGTGDGRFVQHIAQADPNCFVIGVDACRENLQDVSRRAQPNTLFVIANAQALPHELGGLASQITINFPWGSLIEGLLEADERLLDGLVNISRPNTALEVRLNGGALAEVGWSLEQGVQRVRDVLSANGFAMRQRQMMSAHELKTFPTTWTKRIAFGRDPHAMILRGVTSYNRVIHPEYAAIEAV
jgi:16S rRNA (adenine(1408)-N(1))-methyltransferase